MSLSRHMFLLTAIIALSACVKGNNPNDPFESINRKTYQFNEKFDKYLLRPSAVVYRSLIPSIIRTGVNNAYNNVNMIPTVANDLLQGELTQAIKDTWRFAINSTLGIAGVMDVAEKCSLPPHSNDLGLTFAKWGDKKSPYVVIPFLGPSTIRDGMGLMLNVTLLTPYPFIRDDAVLYGLLGLRYVDLRSQMIDTEKFMNEALDKYSFIRDAYLQHRNFLINGPKKQQENLGSLYIGDDEATSEFPLTTAQNNAHSTTSA